MTSVQLCIVGGVLFVGTYLILVVIRAVWDAFSDE